MPEMTPCVNLMWECSVACRMHRNNLKNVTYNAQEEKQKQFVSKILQIFCSLNLLVLKGLRRNSGQLTHGFPKTLCPLKAHVKEGRKGVQEGCAALDLQHLS